MGILPIKCHHAGSLPRSVCGPGYEAMLLDTLAQNNTPVTVTLSLYDVL